MRVREREAERKRKTGNGVGVSKAYPQGPHEPFEIIATMGCDVQKSLLYYPDFRNTAVKLSEPQLSDVTFKYGAHSVHLHRVGIDSGLLFFERV